MVTFCHGVRGLVRFGSKIPPVPESFVDAMKREVKEHRGAEEAEEALITISPNVEVGDEVEVAHGPLQGMQGTVLSVPNGSDRVKILLELLGNSQAVDIDLFSILLPRRPTL
jgi:transcriptional antiterminator RfaH